MHVKLTNRRYVTALYAVSQYDYRLYRSIDGGVRWDIVCTLPAPPNGMAWVSPLVGIVVTDSGVYRSENAGATWASVCAGVWNGVAALPDGRVWIVGDTATMKFSQDTGATWATVTLPDLSSQNLNGVAVVANGAGVIAYACGDTISGDAIILTSTTGLNWTLRSSGCPWPLNYIACGHTAATGIYALASVCRNTGSGASVWRTADSGATWAYDSGVVPAYPRQCYVGGTKARAVVGTTALASSVDGSTVFASWAPGGGEFLAGLSDSRAWAMGRSGGVYVSSDHGVSWADVGVIAEACTMAAAVIGYMSHGPALSLAVK